jgi:Flp pilus assembly protein TadD
MRTPVPSSSAPFSRWKRALARYERHASTACLFGATLLLAGCQGIGQHNDITGSIPSSAASVPASQQAMYRYTQDLGRRYDANPKDKQIALAYAHTLRRLTRYAQAVAVLQRLAATYPKDMNILGEYGKALVDDGRLHQAADVLPQAHTPENPNWTILSAQGSVADQLGDHAQARDYYAAALKIVPNQPDVLSNLGLSYALSKQLPLAEKTLKLAVAQPGARARVRQNLALILALEGKFDAAQSVARTDLSPLEAAENVAAVRQMIAQANPWNQIRAIDAKKPKKRAERTHPAKTLAYTPYRGGTETHGPMRLAAEHLITTVPK